MFDREKFKDAVERSGLKGKYIAKEIGMNYWTYAQKCKGVNYWKVDEAMKVSKVLRLRAAERDAIFFAAEVSKTPTSEEEAVNVQ